MAQMLMLEIFKPMALYLHKIRGEQVLKTSNVFNFPVECFLCFSGIPQQMMPDNKTFFLTPLNWLEGHNHHELSHFHVVAVVFHGYPAYIKRSFWLPLAVFPVAGGPWFSPPQVHRMFRLSGNSWLPSRYRSDVPLFSRVQTSLRVTVNATPSQAVSRRK